MSASSTKVYDSAAGSRPKSKGGRPKGEPHTRERILAGATSAFSAEGYEHTTVERILEKAGVARGTFYRFFSNKEEVFCEIAKRTHAVILLEIQQAVANATTLPDKLGAAIVAYLRSCMNAGPIVKVILTEPMPPNSEAAQSRAHVKQTLQEMLHRDILEHRGQTVDPLVLHSLIAAFDDVAVRLAMERNPREWDFQRARRVMARVMGAVLANDDERELVPPLPVIEEDGD